MPFVRVPGLKGKVYVPQKDPECPKKHPCKDCFSCEFCSDDRCGVCRKQPGVRKRLVPKNKNRP